MAMRLPTTIDKKRVVKIGGGARAQRQTFNIGIDMVTQGLDDVRAILRQTTAEATAEQMRAGNPPSSFIVDGRQKNLEAALYKVEVYFGAFIQRAVMVQIEVALHNAIKRSTRARTGALRNIRESWQWLHLSGREVIYLSGPQDIKTFSNDDKLLLIPKLNYAGIVDAVTARHAGRFTSQAAKAVKGKSQFRSLSISNGVSVKHPVTGEKSRLGTPYISVKVSRGRARRRR